MNNYINQHMERLSMGERTILILPLVKGLVRNREIVERVINEEKPDALALPLSQEGLEDLKAWSGDIDDVPLSVEDMYYLKGLEQFGEACLPPPEHMAAMEFACKAEIPLLPIDMDEEEFSKMYVNKVSIFDLRKRSLLPRKLKKMNITASSPEEYADAWESILSSNKGLAAVEDLREEYMASSIENYSTVHKKILVLIEYERSRGVLSRLTGEVPPEIL